MGNGGVGYILLFTKGVTVTAPSQDRVVIGVPVTYRQLVFNEPSSGLRRVIDVLASTGATEEGLAEIILEADGPDALAGLYYHLKAFARHRIISYCISCNNGKRFATLDPLSAFFRFSPDPVNPEGEYVLSRFAYLHREQGEMVMESPLARARITLHGPEGAAIVAELAGTHALTSLCDLLPDVPADGAILFVEMLCRAGFAHEAKPEETDPEEKGGLIQWEFHDLLFHARSRLGRHANPYGATYRFHHRVEPLPVIKPGVGENIIPLSRPDIERLKEEDFPFTLVLEERRSVREYGKEPITERQLGEFLFRTARIKAILKREYEEVSRRPYPGGGAIYELELYPIVGACRDIPSGLYHYCPDRHVLEKISDLTETVETLLKDARAAAGIEEALQVLITIAARFQRLSWKYESVAYSVVLKDVGVLYQTMYLVATAMDLAPCGLGGGDSDLFAKATGLDYFTETSVGEFLIGSKRV